jgi:hypothetical protein
MSWNCPSGYDMQCNSTTSKPRSDHLIQTATNIHEMKGTNPKRTTWSDDEYMRYPKAQHNVTPPHD